MFCRKRSFADSPPQVEVTVKRCASCPESCKPLGNLHRSRECQRLLPGLFQAKKSGKRFFGLKWSSVDDVCLHVASAQPPGALGHIEEGNFIAPKVFSNPLYQPPESTDPPQTTPNESTDPPQTTPNESTDPLQTAPKGLPMPSVTITRSPSETSLQKEKIDGESTVTNPKPMTTEALEPRLFKMESCRWKRKESKFVHTQPLYQDYWLHHTKPHQDAASILSADASLSFTGLLSSSLLGESSGHVYHREYTSKLWQDLPEVKGQDILERFNARQRWLQEAIFEVVTSEASYQRSLSVAVFHFQKSHKLSECLVTTDQHTLFSNLAGVRDVSERFLLDLEDAFEKDVFLSEIGDLILRHCPAFHRVYVPYVTNQMYQEKLMQQLVENGKFLQVLRKLEEQPVCKRQLLKSFLVLPFQRITRLKILLENILKLVQEDSSFKNAIRKALAAVGQIVSECNEGVRSMMQTEELVLLEKKVEFINTKSFPLISRGRKLLQHGELAQILFQEMGVAHRARLSTKPLYLHLFSDLLLLSSKTDNGRFLVTDYASRGQVKADHVKAKALGLPNLAFLLRLCRNHAGTSCELILEASSETEKQHWISVITNQMSNESNC